MVNNDFEKERRGAYPSIERQLDALYWDMKTGTTNWLDLIDGIKVHIPKPPVEEPTE